MKRTRISRNSNKLTTLEEDPTPSKIIETPRSVGKTKPRQGGIQSEKQSKKKTGSWSMTTVHPTSPVCGDGINWSIPNDNTPSTYYILRLQVVISSLQGCAAPSLVEASAYHQIGILHSRLAFALYPFLCFREGQDRRGRGCVVVKCPVKWSTGLQG